MGKLDGHLGVVCDTYTASFAFRLINHISRLDLDTTT